MASRDAAPGDTTAPVEIDDEIVAASHEVDLTLIREFLRLSPRERLEAASQHARTLDRFRHGRSSTGRARDRVVLPLLLALQREQGNDS